MKIFKNTLYIIISVILINLLSFGTVMAESSVTAELFADNIGHIFTDKNISLTTKIKKGAANTEYVLYVADEDGNEVYSKAVTVGSAGTGTRKFDFTVPKYGFYSAKLCVGNTSVAATRFSVVRKSSELNTKIGLNSHYQVGRGTEDVAALQKLFADTGFGQMREGVPWAQYEASVGSYNLTWSHKSFLSAFKNNKQNNIVILGHDNSARGITFPRTTAELNAWSTYVEKLAIDIAKYGIKDFELWNEVNMYEMKKGGVSAQEYVNLIKVTKPILDKYIPDNRLFAFSLAGEQYTDGWSDFMDECFAISGCKENIDGISYHPYHNGCMPEREFAKAVAEIDTTVEKWKLEDKAIIISEIGYTYTEETEKSLDEQAEYSVRLAAMAFGVAEYTDWFMNVEKIDQDNPEQLHFGYLRGWKNQEVNYEAKPVFVAMANFNSLTAGTEANGNASMPEKDRYLYKFKKGNKDVYMMWKTSGKETIKLAVGGDRAEVYDFYGNSVQRQTRNGTLYLTISEKPIYVVGEFSDCTYIDGNIVRVRGKAEEKEESVSIMVLRPEGVTAANTGNIVYVGETKTDKDGNYSFSFKDPAYDKGRYKVRLRVGNELSETAYEYVIAMPNVTLTDGENNEVKNLEDIKGNKLNARVEVINIMDYNVDGTVIYGLYKDNVPIRFDMRPMHIDKSETVKNYPIDYAVGQGVDTIKVFVWNSENYSPLVESIVVE